MHHWNHLALLEVTCNNDYFTGKPVDRVEQRVYMVSQNQKKYEFVEYY